jgi:hypothetical protein
MTFDQLEKFLGSLWRTTFPWRCPGIRRRRDAGNGGQSGGAWRPDRTRIFICLAGIAAAVEPVLRLPRVLARHADA